MCIRDRRCRLKEEIRLPIPKRYPIVTDYTHTGALPAPLLFDGTFGWAAWRPTRNTDFRKVPTHDLG